MSVNPKFFRRFSIGHWDHSQMETSTFAKAFCNSSKEFQDEIADIYFGSGFQYDYNGRLSIYGDVMGKIASEGQVRDLLNLQESTGVPISLTFNQMTFNPELVADKEVREGFIKHIRNYYDAGVRVCTISDIHLFNSGVLQESFPDMHWKNTVNHMVRTSQEVADYAAMGFNTILIDRCFNRNIDELKKAYVLSEKLNVKLSLLASEGCMPNCPFKREHDAIQPWTQNGFNPTSNQSLTGSYWDVFGGLSCNRWRDVESTPSELSDLNYSLMPRLGTDIVAVDKDTFDLFLDNTHILKFSGRLSNVYSVPDGTRFVYSNRIGEGRWDLREGASLENGLLAESWTEIYERNLVPFHTWRHSELRPIHGKESVPTEQVAATQARHSVLLSKSVWGQKKAKGFDRILRNCQNQCYDCHACEKMFNVDPVDSLLSIQSGKDWVSVADTSVPVTIGKRPPTQ